MLYFVYNLYIPYFLLIAEESQKEDVFVTYNPCSGRSYSGAYTLFFAQMSIDEQFSFVHNHTTYG